MTPWCYAVSQHPPQQIPASGPPAGLLSNSPRGGVPCATRRIRPLPEAQACGGGGRGVARQHLTRDGQVVVAHDGSLDRLAGVEGRIEQGVTASLQPKWTNLFILQPPESALGGNNFSISVGCKNGPKKWRNGSGMDPPGSEFGYFFA